MIKHTSEQVSIQTYASRPDLTDQPLLEPETKWFTDRSSFVLNGERKAGYAVVNHEEVIEAQPLPAGTSAQKAELIALIRTLTLGKGKRVSVYTDSKYAFLVLHAHAAIWKERGLFSRRKSPIKHGKEILQLLEAVHRPKEVAVIHCHGHQRPNW
jgi:ribonuclease HI